MKIKRTPKFDYLVCVKNQYEAHLINLLVEPFYMKFKEIAQTNIKNTKSKKLILKNFQEELKKISEWDYELLKKNCKFIIHRTNSKYVPKLIKSVIISSTKLLIETSSRKKTKVEYEIPDTLNFLKKCFNIISRNFYLEPTLLVDVDQSPNNRLKNLNNSLNLIKDSINKVINSFLPYDDILEIYLNNIDDDSSDDESSEDEQEDNVSDEEDIDDEELPDDDEDIDEEEMKEEFIDKQEIIEEIKDDNLPNENDDLTEDEEDNQEQIPQQFPEEQETQQIPQQIPQQPVQQMQQPVQQMQQPMQQQMQQPVQPIQVQPQQELKIDQTEELPEEFNFIPMKSSGDFKKPEEKKTVEIKQIQLPKTESNFNFLKNVQ